MDRHCRFVLLRNGRLRHFRQDSGSEDIMATIHPCGPNRYIVDATIDGIPYRGFYRHPEHARKPDDLHGTILMWTRAPTSTTKDCNT